MKRIVSILIILSTMLIADSSINMRVGGMTCAGCASGINESFSEEFPNYKVHLDYDTAIMHVQSKDGSDIDINKFKEALEEMGFKGKLVL